MSPNYKERVQVELDNILAENPGIDQSEAEDLAFEAATDYMTGWADMMIDRAKDERMMDEGGGSQARESKDNVR
jgi:hypothetical protein